MLIGKWNEPLVVPERSDVVDDVGDVTLADLAVEQRDLAVRKAGLRPAAEVEDDLDQGLLLGQGVNGLDDLGGKRREQDVEVIDRFTAAIRLSHAGLH